MMSTLLVVCTCHGHAVTKLEILLSTLMSWWECCCATSLNEEESRRQPLDVCRESGHEWKLSVKIPLSLSLSIIRLLTFDLIPTLILKLCPVQWSRSRGEKFESEIVICWRRALSRWQGEVIIRLALELESTFFVKGSTYHDYRCRTCIPLIRYLIELEVVPVPCTRREREKWQMMRGKSIASLSCGDYSASSVKLCCLRFVIFRLCWSSGVVSLLLWKLSNDWLITSNDDGHQYPGQVSQKFSPFFFLNRFRSFQSH